MGDDTPQRPGVAAHIGLGGLGCGKALVVGGGDRKLAAQVLGEALRAFELGGRLRGAESTDSGGVEIVHQSGHERRLGPDDDELNLHDPAEVDDRPVVGHIEGHIGRDHLCARIARRDEEL